MALPVAPSVLNMKAVFGPNSDGSYDPFFAATNPTPPGKLEYLITLDAIVLGAVTTPYACTGMNTNTSDAAGTGWNWAEMFAPGTHTMRMFVTRVPGTTDGTPGASTITGGGDGVQISIPPGVGNGVEATSMGNTAVIDPGGEGYDATPAADDNRVTNIAAAREPTLEIFAGDSLFGFGGYPKQSLDLTVL